MAREITSGFMALCRGSCILQRAFLFIKGEIMRKELERMPNIPEVQEEILSFWKENKTFITNLLTFPFCRAKMVAEKRR